MNRERFTSDDEKLMYLALSEANIAYEEGEVPIGAIITHNGKIIAKAHNQVECLHDPTAHAEMLAITQAVNNTSSKYLKDCTIYVTIEPCPMCMGALRWAQIKRVVFGAREKKFGYRLFSSDIPHPKTEVIEGVLSENCSTIMKEFFKEKRD